MRDISAGLHERYARDVKKLSLDILPGITYQSPDGTVTNEYKNRGDTAPSPMLQLLEKHRDVRHFQLVGKGGSSCGGVGKTSTLLNLAFSLTSSSNAPDIAPLYIQLRRIYGINSKSKNNENRILHYMREEYKLTEADRNASFIFLLDGFNEIPTTTMQIRCLRDILDISDKKYPEAAIILSNRDPLDTYMDLLEYENGFDADQIDRLKFYFHNCYIKELSQEQIDDYFEPNQRCLVPAARNILDTPFYLVLYRQAMQPSGKDAGRWITDAFQDHLNNGTPEKTTLMLQMLLREIDNLRSDITSAERELRCFILTKVLPYLGYWKGRLLLEQAKQDHDRCNDYKDAAIASFCATNVTERFDHLPENADEDAAPQLSPPQWLSAIELLRYPDRAVFRVDRRMVFQTIYQKLTQQVEEVQSDNIQIHNERYRLTKKDVRSNLERCLDMVKAQFPDKEPLIQKMIRSIR